jgi:Holliday junction resolvasome RuvABC ATP-dependent DNA helicase subunit
MQVKKIDLETTELVKADFRPVTFQDFIGQEDITRVVKTAIASSRKSNRVLGHMLLLGPA